MSLTVLITTARGDVYRCGADDGDAAWIPFNIGWSSELPGGTKEIRFSLARRIDDDSLPLTLLDEVEIIDEQGQSLCSGRIVQLPREHGENYLLNVVCLGWATHLLDDKSFAVIFRDMDLTRWGSMSLQRRSAVITVGRRVEPDPVVRPDVTTGEPALTLTIQGPWGAGVDPFVEGIYDAGAGNLIGEIYYAWKRITNVVPTDPNWVWGVGLGDDDLFTNNDGSGNLVAAGPDDGVLVATGPRRFAQVALGYDTGSGVEGTQELAWPTLAVTGDHGLTKQGIEPKAGYYIDDMLAYALARACPKLNFTTGEGGTIERPPLVISQAAYHEPSSVDAVLLDLNKYVLWEWGIRGRREFFYRQPHPDRLTWEARLDQGIHLSLEGDDAEHIYTGAVVRYSLPDGTRRVAGPVGSGYDVESDLLEDFDEANVARAHGYPRRWLPVDITFPILDDYAPVIGGAHLLQAAFPARSGSIKLVGFVRHPTKGLRPVREIEAMDWIRLSDHPADVARRIIKTDYNEDTQENTVTVGTEINEASAMLEQVSASTLRFGGG